MWSWRKRSHEDFAEEIHAHIAQEIKRLVDEEGMNVRDAKAQALWSFGNIAQAQERFYERGRLMWLDDMRRDLLYAVRNLRRNPGFAAIAIVTIALGIGANAAIFSVINAVLLKPLPYRQPDQLVRLNEITPGSITQDGRERRSGAISVTELKELRSRSSSVSHVSMGGGLAIMTFSGRGESVRLQGHRVASDLFETLGVSPMLGRGFNADELSDGAADVVLSFAAWMRYFGADPNIVGQTRTLANSLSSKPDPRQYTIVGVMPESFWFPDRQIEFWIPMPWRPASRGAMIGRLASDHTAAAAAAEVGTILRELRKTKPEVRYDLTSASESSAIDDLRPALFVLMAAACFVLLIACVNVANLLFARSTARQRETAVRIALGAGRGRLIRYLLTESTMLAVCGGALGILLAVGGIELLKSLATTLARMDLGIQLAFPRLEDITIDLTVLVFVFALSVFAGVLLGLMPAIAHSRAEHMMTLRETSPASSGFRLSGRGGSATVLVAAEISLSLILLVGAGLLTHSFIKLTRVDPGYDAANVLTFQVALPLDRYPTPQLKSFADGLVARLRTIPGVKAAAYGQPPLVAITEGAFFRKTPEVPTKAAAGVERRLVSPDYLDVMGIRVLAGRGFTEHDRAGQPRVLLINQALARREFPGENPLGRHVYAGTDSQPWEIVGIVLDVRQVSIDREPEPQWFVTYDQWPGDAVFPLGPYFSLRTESDPALLVPQVHATVRQADAEGGVFNIATMEQLVSNRIARPRLYAVLLAIFAGIAVALAAIGIFGVMAYSVTRRTREIGIRVALGARHSEVVALVLRQSLVSITIGLATGLCGAAAMTQYLEGMLFGVTPLDAMTFMSVSVVFVAVAMLAAFIPARRAAMLNPLVALRTE